MWSGSTMLVKLATGSCPEQKWPHQRKIPVGLKIYMWAYLVTRVQCMYVLIEVGPSCALLAGPVDVGVGAPSLSMTFDLFHVPPTGLAEAFQSGLVS